ncbi:MAG: hypothetical protein DPW09_17880 [Anaerolineae bacterium]|nr:hypothetical protein [Anaerolineae bacterium]
MSAEQLLRQQESLRQVIESISSELELRPLLTRIVRHACELIGADNGTIGLVDEQAGVIRTEAIFEMPAAELGAEMPPGVGLAGQVWLTQQPLILDRYGDVDQPLRTELSEYTVIGLPIFWREKMIGFFGIGTAPPRRFTPHDVETLTVFARHAAIAIENARLFEAEKRRATRIATINRLGQLITSGLALDQLLQQAVETICDDLHLDSLGLALIDPADPDMLILLRAVGAYAPDIPPNFRQSIHVGICGIAARTRQSVLLNDVSRNPDYISMPGVDDIYAELVVPVVVGEQLLGVLNFESRQPIMPEDVADLEIVAHQLGVAIENARLFEAEKRRAARVAIINRVARLIAGNLDLEQLLQTAVEAIAGYLYYQNVALLLVDPADPETLVLRASSGIYATAEILGYRQKIDRGIIGAAIETRRYLLINDVRRDPRYVSIPGGDTITAELAIPIIIGERLVGALNIESEQPMSQEDAAGFEIIADQLGVAIENARLFAETQSALNQTQLLYQTSQRISTAMEVDEVIRAYLEQVAARGRYACSVVLYEFDDQGQRSAVIVRGQWTREKGLIHLAERIPYSRDDLDPPLDAGQTITVSDAQTDPRIPPALRRVQLEAGRPALAFIPLMVRGQRIGLVVLSDVAPHAWEPADLHPYQATAAQLATAIDSRRQHYLLSERGRQIAVLKERQRLARDLHDSVTQLIFSITLIAQSVAPAWRRDPAEGERRIQRLLELSQSALAEMRALLAELRPPDSQPLPPGPVPGIVQVQRDGLVAALQSHIANLARDGLQVKLNAAGYVRQPLEQEETLYRIAQEALNNVVKHARAQTVELKLLVNQQFIQLKVVDDGVGFAPTASVPSADKTKGGLGLTTMRERAEALGGTVQLTAAPGSGATVTVTIPRKDGSL